jgi:DNA primase
VILCDEFHIYIPENSDKNEAWKKSIIQVRRADYTADTVPVFDKDVAEFIMINTQLTEIGRTFLIDERKHLCSVVEKSNIHSVEDPNALKNKLTRTFGVDRLIKSKVLKDDARHLTIDSPSLIIPYYDEQNTLIGLQTRFLGNDNPDLHIPRFKRICNSQIRIYNLPILNTIPYGENLYITEGITDCLAMLSSGYNAVAIPSATSFPLEDIKKLRGFNLFMMSDQDKAGDESYIKLYRMMLRYGCILKKVSLPEGNKDYSDYYLNSLNV